jgi:hypothetical protein
LLPRAQPGEAGWYLPDVIDAGGAESEQQVLPCAGEFRNRIQRFVFVAMAEELTPVRADAVTPGRDVGWFRPQEDCPHLRQKCRYLCLEKRALRGDIHHLEEPPKVVIASLIGVCGIQVADAGPAHRDSAFSQDVQLYRGVENMLVFDPAGGLDLHQVVLPVAKWYEYVDPDPYSLVNERCFVQRRTAIAGQRRPR